MKIRLLIVFLLAGLVGFAQTNTDPLDASKVKKLKLLQSSPQDAIAEFGTPAKKDVKNERQKYTFRAKNSVLILEFNKDNALSAYNLTKNFPAAKAHLAGNDVKKINAGATTPDEITKLFGEMTQQVINSREEKWYFGQGSSYLEVDFPSDNPGKVSKFNYTENSLKSENITDNKLEMLTKRIITTGEDLNTQFGVPKKKTITQDKEEWEYQSGYMKVLVQIDKATGKIKNHICQTAGRIPVQQPSQSK